MYYRDVGRIRRNAYFYIYRKANKSTLYCTGSSWAVGAYTGIFPSRCMYRHLPLLLLLFPSLLESVHSAVVPVDAAEKARRCNFLQIELAILRCAQIPSSRNTRLSSHQILSSVWRKNFCIRLLFYCAPWLIFLPMPPLTDARTNRRTGEWAAVGVRWAEGTSGCSVCPDRSSVAAGPIITVVRGIYCNLIRDAYN